MKNKFTDSHLLVNQRYCRSFLLFTQCQRVNRHRCAVKGMWIWTSFLQIVRRQSEETTAQIIKMKQTKKNSDTLFNHTEFCYSLFTLRSLLKNYSSESHLLVNHRNVRTPKSLDTKQLERWLEWLNIESQNIWSKFHLHQNFFFSGKLSHIIWSWQHSHNFSHVKHHSM